MISFMGKVNCNYHNCELTIIDRVFELNYIKDHKLGGHKSLEFTLNGEYYINEEIENETFLDPLIYIVNAKTHKKVMRIASYHGKKLYNEDEFILLDREKIDQLKLHIRELNNNSEEAIARRKKSFLENVTKKVKSCSHNSTIRTIVYNFIDMYPPLSMYKDKYSISKFETIIYNHLDLGGHLNRKYPGNSYWDESGKLDKGQQEDIKNYYDNFLKLVEVINKREYFNSNDEVIYYTWILFNEEVCHYYYDQFHQDHGYHFPNIEALTLKNCLNTYSSIATINVNSSNTISLFTFYLKYLKKFHNSSDYFVCRDSVINKISNVMENKKIDDFEALLLTPITTEKVSIYDVDLMGGHEFELFIAELFNKMGYTANVTKGSGDQGIDVLAEKEGETYGIQTKCYAGSVTNTAIQEVVAGLRYYNLKKGIVITNNYFTKSAKNLALSNNVILWDREILEEKINFN